MNDAQEFIIKREIWGREKEILEKMLFIHNLRGKNPNEVWFINCKSHGCIEDQIKQEEELLNKMKDSLNYLKQGLDYQESTKEVINSQEGEGKSRADVTPSGNSPEPDIHSQNKELMDKDYVKTNKEVRT